MGRARHYEKFDWEDDPTYLKWKKTVSEKTFQGYFYRFIPWMKFIKLSPTEQRTKRFQDLQRWCLCAYVLVAYVISVKRTLKAQ